MSELQRLSIDIQNATSEYVSLLERSENHPKSCPVCQEKGGCPVSSTLQLDTRGSSQKLDRLTGRGAEVVAIYAGMKKTQQDHTNLSSLNLNMRRSKANVSAALSRYPGARLAG